MTAHRVAALQMVSSSHLEENLRVAAQLIAQAAAGGARLVVLPETFAMFSTRAQQSLGEREGQDMPPLREFLSHQARLNKVWIVAGTIPFAENSGERVYASSFVLDEQGREVARYDKIHMFDVDVDDSHGSYRESDTFKPGNRVVVVDSPVGRLGVAVCYDIRFPELFRAMFLQGVDVIAVPAAFTLRTGEAHWLPLLRARAIENQCYIVGANQGGVHSKSRSTSGGSVIIDGWGTVLAEAGRGEACIIADIDLDRLVQIRRKMPVADHLRFDTLPRP